MCYKFIIFLVLILGVNFTFTGHYPIYRTDRSPICDCKKCRDAKFLKRLNKKRINKAFNQIESEEESK